MASSTQAVATKIAVTQHASHPVVNLSSTAVKTTALLTQRPAAPQPPVKPLAPSMKVMAKGGTSPTALKATPPSSSSALSLSSAIAIESANKQASAKTNGPRLVMHTPTTPAQVSAQAAVKAAMDKKGLTKTNSPVLMASKPTIAVPDIATEAAQKAAHAASTLNKTNSSPRSDVQAVASTGSIKPATQPQTILGTAKSVNAATRTALTPNSGSHSLGSTTTTPPSPPQNLALQPMAHTSIAAPATAEQPNQELLKKIDSVYGTSQFDVRMLVGAILKGKLSKDDVLGWALKRMVDSNVISSLVTYKAISPEDLEMWQKQCASKKVTTSPNNALAAQPTTQQKRLPLEPLNKAQILQYLKEEGAKRDVLELHEYCLPLQSGKVTLQDMIDNGIINRAQAETLREAFLQILPVSCLQITPLQNNVIPIASSSSAVSTTRTSAGTIPQTHTNHTKQAELVLRTISNVNEIEMAKGLIHHRPTETYFCTAAGGERFLASKPKGFQFPENVVFCLLTDKEFEMIKRDFIKNITGMDRAVGLQIQKDLTIL